MVWVGSNVTSQQQSSSRLETTWRNWVCSDPSGQMGFTQDLTELIDVIVKLLPMTREKSRS